jgi:Flp pilus assembly protein TadG
MKSIMEFPIMHRISARLRVLAGDRRANTAVEFALAAPALFLFMFGIIEVGYALWMQNALDYSVVATARCASLRGSDCTGSPSKVKSYAVDASGAYLTILNFNYDSGAACGCQVSGNYTIALDIPWTALSVDLSSQACFKPPPSVNCAS